MRVADQNLREMNGREQALAFSVFRNSLPAWRRIWIGDGLGADNRPYTYEDWPAYCIHVGPTMYADVSLTTMMPGSREGDRYCDLLIHEMTHVWQYYNGYWVASRSLYAQFLGKGYDYTLEPTDSWSDFNVEQQAQIVKHWFKMGMSTTDDRYAFIEMIIRANDAGETKETEIGRLAAVDTPVRELRGWMTSRPHR